MQKTQKDKNSEEMSAILSRTEWVEIVLTQRGNGQKPLGVEVEIAPFDLGFRPKEQHELPMIMITHMEYLLGLMNLDFRLQLVDGCWWIASQDFETTPKQGVLEALIPPMV